MNEPRHFALDPEMTEDDWAAARKLARELNKNKRQADAEKLAQALEKAQQYQEKRAEAQAQEEPMSPKLTAMTLKKMSAEKKLELIASAVSGYRTDENEGDWLERAQTILFIATDGKRGEDWGIR